MARAFCGNGLHGHNVVICSALEDGTGMVRSKVYGIGIKNYKLVACLYR